MHKTRAVLVFTTERKNNVDPRLRSQKKVNYVQLFFALIILEFSHLDDIIIQTPHSIQISRSTKGQK